MTDKKYIKFQDLSELIDIGAVEVEARKAWEKQQRRQRRLEQWMMRLMPFGLLVMAVVFYLLSAQHTAMIVNLITPGWGWVAPIGFELGIVIIAAIREARWRSWFTWSLMMSLIGMSIIINVAGGFLSVVDYGVQGDISKLTAVQLIEQFGLLPAALQVALAIVMPFGIAIPVMASMVGESLVKLAMGRIKLQTDDDNARWINEMGRVMYNALLHAALKAGAGANTAAKWARAVTNGMSDYDPGVDARARGLVATNPSPAAAMGFLAIRGQKVLSQDSPGLSEQMFVSQNATVAGNAQVQNDRKDGLSQTVRVKKDDVVAWMRGREDWQHLSDRDVARMYMQEKFGVDSDSAYKTVQRARKDMQ